MNKISTVTISLVAILALSACGGGSSSHNTQTGTAYYLDSAVAGVDYECGTQKAKTDKDGKFTFEKGKSCTFTLADIELRKTDASELTDGKKILEDNVKVAQFLQSLDKDGDASNGITITPEIVEVLSSADVIKLPENKTELDEVVKLLENAKKEGHVEYSGHAVTPEEAMNHLDDTKSQIVAQERVFTFPSKFYGDIKKDYNDGETYKFEAGLLSFSADKKFSFTELAFENGTFVVDKDENNEESFHFENGQWIKDNNNMTLKISKNNKVITLNDTYELTMKSVKDITGKSRTIRHSNISVSMPKGAEEIKLGFKILKESYGIDEKKEHYDSLFEIIEKKCGTRYFTHAADNSGIKGIAFACNQENQLSGTMVGVKDDNTLITNNIGTWEIKNLPDSTEKAIFITLNKKYQRHSDVAFYATKNGEVWRGWRDIVGEQEPIITYNQKAFDAFTAKINEVSNDS